MATPFYVSPEQLMKDRADYARKGIARGRSVVALVNDSGYVRIADQAVAEVADRVLAGRMTRPDGPAAALT